MVYAMLVVAIVVYLFVKYGEPRLEVYHALFRERKTNELDHLNNIKTIEQCEVARKYPELRNDGGRSNVIGFRTNDYYEDYEEEYDEDYEEEEEVVEDKNRRKTYSKKRR